MIKIIQSLTKWTLSKYSQLQNLWLVDCKFKSYLNDFINELGSFSQLRLLDITGNEIGDTGCNYLCKSLQVNRSLQSLSFDKSNVTIQAYINIIEALKRFDYFCFWFYKNMILIYKTYKLEILRLNHFKCQWMIYVFYIKSHQRK